MRRNILSVSGTRCLVLFAAGQEIALVLTASVLVLVPVLEGCVVDTELGAAVAEGVLPTL